MKGKIALVSGAASGLGAAQASLFAKEGARVVIGDVQEEAGQAVAKRIVEEGGQALEFAKQGIRVNAILPGRIDTPIAGEIAPEQLAAVNAKIPMGWTGDPSDIAQGAVYLASDEARYVTGAELIIDGGWYASAGSMINPPEPRVM